MSFSPTKAISFSSLYTLKYFSHLGDSTDADEVHTIKKKIFNIYPFAYPGFFSFYDIFIYSNWRFTICWKKNTFTV